MTTADKSESRKDGAQWLYRAALANAILWVLSIVALIIVMQRGSSANGLFVVLASGTAMGCSMVALARKPAQPD